MNLEIVGTQSATQHNAWGQVLVNSSSTTHSQVIVWMNTAYHFIQPNRNNLSIVLNVSSKPIQCNHRPAILFNLFMTKMAVS